MLLTYSGHVLIFAPVHEDAPGPEEARGLLCLNISLGLGGRKELLRVSLLSQVRMAHRKVTPPRSIVRVLSSAWLKTRAFKIPVSPVDTENRL